MSHHWTLPACTTLLASVVAAADLPVGRTAPDGDGVSFDGTTCYRADVPALPSDGKHVSLAAWVKLDHVGDDSQVILNRGRANSHFTLYLFRGQVRMLVGHRPGAYSHAHTPAPPPGAWVHLTGTYDGAQVRLYQNGHLVHAVDAPGSLPVDQPPLFLGSLNQRERPLRGRLADVRIWDRTLAPEEVTHLAAGRTDRLAPTNLLAHWQAPAPRDGLWKSTQPAYLEAESMDMSGILINEKADGFRGIWYFNQPSNDEYVYKYSGGLGTYCAKHIPLAWHSPEAEKTFFCYGGTDADNSTLLHMVSYYDHRNGTLARPTILLDKLTTDAHDNPVINLDDQGIIWIFSSSHGKARPSYISRSVRPYDISEFELVWSGNFSYPQPFHYPGRGFLMLHTWYEGGRSLYAMSSRDGVTWSERSLFSKIEMGQYQTSFPWNDRVGTAFNMHPEPKGLNWRTNLYYMQSADFGTTWQNAAGEPLDVPLTERQNPALVADFAAQGLNVYMKDITYDSTGKPIILFLTSKGYESGPENMPRTWTTARWTGTTWQIRGKDIVSDNNYDTGPLYVESDTHWRIIGPTESGPQPYNPGGEVAMWLSENAGESWQKIRQLTSGSDFNHTYVRRPVNAHPDFYAFWADGHGRQPSESRLYFCNRDGDVFRMPVRISADHVTPQPVP